MTFGLPIPLFFLNIATVEFAIFRRLQENGTITRQAAKLMMIASVSLPIITYAILNRALPDVGAARLF